ncbi:MAG TPA: histidine phosphatase family protein, partial [Chthonomonadaceae bacterium]|nr:histidine phosphatase family protein [Chthonomonadaceae bacterium]
MRIYFLRHGEAENRASSGRDFDRALTDAGIAQMKRVAKGIAWLAPEVAEILTSPLPRARKTAELAAAELKGGQLQVRVADGLASGCFDIGELDELTTGMTEGRRIMLVGHEPDFSE